jgi:hypothetical protein
VIISVKRKGGLHIPFYWFVIGSVLLVLGLTFEVTAVTSGLTKMKNSAAGKKFRNVGIMSIICGFLVFLVALKDMVGNERNAMQKGYDSKCNSFNVCTLLTLTVVPGAFALSIEVAQICPRGIPDS